MLAFWETSVLEWWDLIGKQCFRQLGSFPLLLKQVVLPKPSATYFGFCPHLSVCPPAFFSPQCCSSLGFVFSCSKRGLSLVLLLAVPSGRGPCLSPSLRFSLLVTPVSSNATYPEKQKQPPCVPLTLRVLRTGRVIARGSPHLSASHHTYMCHKGGAL